MSDLSSPCQGPPSGFPGAAAAYHHAVTDLLLVLIVILVIVLVIRGPKTLPEIGRMFGRGVREAREELNKARGDEPPSSEDTKSA